MAKSTLFEYVVIWNPNDTQSKEGQKSKLIDGPKCMLAKEEKSVFMTVVSQIPEEYREQLEQIDVTIRPF